MSGRHVLIVDDEPGIVRALTRLLRREGYVLHEAASGPEALEILRREEIAVIICDQNMPGMSGVEVLAEACRIRPDTYRITLTGLTDPGTAQATINQGRVNHFIFKPWNDEALLEVVREGVRSHEMIRENRRLHELTHQQKQELETWNRELEDKVELRTRELHARNERLRELRASLERSLRDTVAVLAGMLEAYDPSLGTHAKRVSQIARHLGTLLGLDEEALRDVEFAAYLHDIGKISRLYNDPQGARAPHGEAPKKRRPDHPLCGYAILSRVSGFENVAIAVRHLRERFDGTGRPEGLKAERIPIASRITVVANAYDKVVYTSKDPTKPSPDAGRRLLLDGKGTTFDPEIVDLMLRNLDDIGLRAVGQAEIEMSAKQVEEGMILSRDLCNAEGVLMLKAGTLLTPRLIESIGSWSEVDPVLSRLFVQCRPRDESEGGEADAPPDMEELLSMSPAEAAAPPDDQAAGHEGSSPPTEVPGRPGAAATASTQPHPRRVLVVDDTEAVCRALQRELRHVGISTMAAHDGADALGLLRTERFDAIVSDLLMPRMDGVELVRRLLKECPDVPVIILTGNPTRERVIHLMKQPNVVGFLVKPWEREKLMARLEQAFSRAGTQQPQPVA